MAGFDKARPGQTRALFAAGRPAHGRRVVRQPHRETRAREPFDKAPAIGEYALHRRSGVAAKVCMLTS